MSFLLSLFLAVRFVHASVAICWGNLLGRHTLNAIGIEGSLICNITTLQILHSHSFKIFSGVHKQKLLNHTAGEPGSIAIYLFFS